MKKKGNMYQASVALTLDGTGDKFPIFSYAKLATNQYLVVIPSVLRQDPIKNRYAIVSERKFLSMSKGYQLQEVP